MRPLTSRLVTTFAALDLVFKVLVGLAFLQVMAAGAPARRNEVLQYIALIAGPIWLVWITIVGLSGRTIDRFVAAEQAGGASADQHHRR